MTEGGVLALFAVGQGRYADNDFEGFAEVCKTCEAALYSNFFHRKIGLRDKLKRRVYFQVVDILFNRSAGIVLKQGAKISL